MFRGLTLLILLAPTLALRATEGKQADAGEKMRDAIEKARGQDSYRTKYRAVIKAPFSDPMVIEGASVWVKPGVLYIHYKASGGDEKRIIRVGEKVWIYHEFVEDWVTAEEMGNKGAGRGVQNPDEVLGVVLKHARKVSAGGNVKLGARATSAYDVAMTGPEIEKMMLDYTSQGTFDWNKSKASARVLVDPKEGLIYKFKSDADLMSTDPKVNGIVRHSAVVEVIEYGKPTPLKFTVRDGRTGKQTTIPVPEFIKKEIEKLGKRNGEKK